jgi:hypothetical protein
MAKIEKKKKAYLTGHVVVKATLSQLRDPAVAKDHVRGPRHIGQLKHSDTIRIGRLSQEEISRRLKMARVVLETGKGPKVEKGGAPKTQDDTEKGREAAEKKLAVVTEELVEVKEKLTLTNQAFQEQTKTLEDLKSKVNLPDPEPETTDPGPPVEEPKSEGEWPEKPKAGKK